MWYSYSVPGNKMHKDGPNGQPLYAAPRGPNFIIRTGSTGHEDTNGDAFCQNTRFTARAIKSYPVPKPQLV